MSDVEIQIKGLDKVINNLASLRGEIKSTLRGAGEESAKHILHQRGLQNYPPATAANRPPPPYYIRGVGMQYKSKNNGKSENYGTKFYVKSGNYTTRIGNNASYAEYLAGERQSRKMAAIGWRKLLDVANEQITVITAIFLGWIDRLITRYKL